MRPLASGVCGCGLIHASQADSGSSAAARVRIAQVTRGSPLSSAHTAYNPAKANCFRWLLVGFDPTGLRANTFCKLPLVPAFRTVVRADLPPNTLRPISCRWRLRRSVDTGVLPRSPPKKTRSSFFCAKLHYRSSTPRDPGVLFPSRPSTVGSRSDTYRLHRFLSIVIRCTHTGWLPRIAQVCSRSAVCRFRHFDRYVVEPPFGQ